jgi:transposase InsO family protein
MIYKFIDDHRKRWPVELMCNILEISASGYYHYRKHGEGKRELKKQALRYQITEVYFQAHQRYGSPRIAKELTQLGYPVSSVTVAKRMKEIGLRSKLSKKFKATTDSKHKEPIAENILDRNFIAVEPGQKCVSDITYIQTIEGFIYLTTVIDLFDRKIIGWSLSDNMKTIDTVLPAIKMACTNRLLKQGMIFHSDRGVQYCCKETVNYIKSYKFIQSMSRKGNCWDNAVAESFFKSFKSELIYGNKLKPKEQMKLDVFEYIECWYNKSRRHSALQNQTIDEFNNNKPNFNKSVA